jgi:hypothetical protein
LTKRQLGRLGDAAREDYDEARHDWHANFGILRTPQLAAIHEALEQIVATNRQDPDRVRGAAVLDAFTAPVVRLARSDPRLEAQEWINQRLQAVDAAAPTDLHDLGAVAYWFRQPPC